MIFVLVVLLGCGLHCNEKVPFDDIKKPDELAITISSRENRIIPEKPIEIEIAYSNISDTEIFLNDYNVHFPGFIIVPPNGDTIWLRPRGPVTEIDISPRYPYLTPGKSYRIMWDLRKLILEHPKDWIEYPFAENGSYKIFLIYINEGKGYRSLSDVEFIALPSSSNVIELER